ncbi:MAG: hypothetical protein NTZ05_16745, partial [Chloroflexi bacterium]|nr:hypothetical protein [Chloroflexota bacterium]
SFRTPVATSASISAVSPAPGAKVSGAAASVQWTDLNPAVFYYEVQVSPDPRFNTDPAQATAAVWWNLVHGGQTAPLNSWRMPPLEPGVTYYWRVRPRLQGDATPALWSASWSFIAE